MNSKTNNIIIIILLSVVIIVVSVVFWFGALFVVKSFSEVHLLGSTTTSKGGVDKLNILRREVHYVQPLFDKIKKLSLSRDDVPKLLNDIESTGKGVTNVTISNINADENLLNITADFKCSLRDCLDVVDKINNVSKLVGIDTINIMESDEEKWATSMRIQLLLDIQQ